MSYITHQMANNEQENQNVEKQNIKVDDDNISNTSESIPVSPLITSPTVKTFSPNVVTKNKVSKKLQRLEKQRDRMRKRRKFEKAERTLLNKQLEELTKQLHQLLKIQEYQNTQRCTPGTGNSNNTKEESTTSLSLTKKSQKGQLMNSYIELIALSEKLRQENEEHEQLLSQTWKKYARFIDNQLHLYETMSPVGMSPLTTVSAKRVMTFQATHPIQLKTKGLNMKDKSQWLSFTVHATHEENNTLLFRESTEDVFYRKLSSSACKSLLADAYDQAQSFNTMMQYEVVSNCGARVTEMDYFGWKLIYYPISTQEAYPHLTQVTPLEILANEKPVNDMLRFDYIKRYVLEPDQDFQSMFVQIQERCWKMMISPIPIAGLHFTIRRMPGCVLQTINDRASITIRSFMNRKSQRIRRFISLVHQDENEIFVTMLNPLRCLNRVEGRDKMVDGDSVTSQNSGEKVVWETHGHARFSWRPVGEREFEIRYGGTTLLMENDLNAHVTILGERLLGWEQVVFSKSIVQLSLE